MFLDNSQIGSKITSKRVCQFLEFCRPHSYILVDKHPCRHDPSHVVTHRIQSTITEFADVLLRTQVPRKPSRWSLFLKSMEMMVRVLTVMLTFSIKSIIYEKYLLYPTSLTCLRKPLHTHSCYQQECHQVIEGWYQFVSQ